MIWVKAELELFDHLINGVLAMILVSALKAATVILSVLRLPAWFEKPQLPGRVVG